MLNKDFEEFVTKRCEEALLENAEYSDIENIVASLNTIAEYEELLPVIIGIVESICYKKGFKDATQLLSKEV